VQKFTPRMPTLFLLSKNTSATHKYVLKDLVKFVPNAIKESKCNGRKEIQELMSIHECDTLLYFECTKRRNTMWLVKSGGPSIECNVDVMFSIDRLKFLVNTYLNVGHVLLFQPVFEDNCELKALKNVLTDIFRREDELCERAMLFAYEDGKVFLRNYKLDDELQEIGPRMVFTVRKVYEDEFCGNVTYENLDLLEGEEKANDGGNVQNNTQDAHSNEAAPNLPDRIESQSTADVDKNAEIKNEDILDRSEQGKAIECINGPNEHIETAGSISNPLEDNSCAPVGDEVSTPVTRAGKKRAAAPTNEKVAKTAKRIAKPKAELPVPVPIETEPVLDESVSVPAKKRAPIVKKSTSKTATPRRTTNYKTKSATPSRNKKNQTDNSADVPTKEAPVIANEEPVPVKDATTKAKRARTAVSKNNDQREEEKNVEEKENNEESKNIHQKQGNKKAVKRGNKK
ncbi:RNA-binding protein required for biogenesis of the ribosomal 60S subunit, partial [Trachipleistophora hominis]